LPISRHYMFAKQHCLLPTRHMVHCGPVAPMSLFTGQLSGLWVGDYTVAFVLRILAIVFRIHKDKSKMNMSRKTALLRSLNGFLSSLPELDWNSNTGLLVVQHIICQHLRRGFVGIRNWGRRCCIRPYGGICVLQAS